MRVVLYLGILLLLKAPVQLKKEPGLMRLVLEEVPVFHIQITFQK